MRERRVPRVLGLFASLVVACGSDAPAPSSSEHSGAPTREVQGPIDTSEPPASSACARDLAERTPDAVRATLGDLGYDALFDDACLAQQAEREGDPTLCQQLTASQLRDRCVARVAIARARPADCPVARTIDGRDPLCVALAARDRRLCVVAGVLERAVCEAALGRERACAQLPDSERDACTARATDLAARVEGEVRTRPALEPAATLTSSDGTSRALASADRGARIVYRGCTRVVLVGDAEHLTRPFGVAAIALDVVASGEPPIEASISALPSDLATRVALTLDGSHAHAASGGSVSLDVLEPELGGRVEGSFHAVLSSAAGAVDGTFSTFVRDLDPVPDACAAPR